MPGPTEPWDHSGDPRESTADLPRPEVTGPAASSAAPASNALPDGTGTSGSGVMAPAAPRQAAAREAAGAIPAEDADPRPEPAPLFARATGSGATGSRATGSLADLRMRLASLPDGHPSSPYEDGGRVRPSPIRLRHLELGLPAPGREPAEQDGAARVDQVSPPSDRSAAPPSPPTSAPVVPGAAPGTDASPTDHDQLDQAATALPQDPYAGASAANGHGGGPTLRPWPKDGVAPRGNNGNSGPWRAGLPTRDHRNGDHRLGNDHDTEILQTHAEPVDGRGRERDARTGSQASPRPAGSSQPSAFLQDLVERIQAGHRAAEGQNVFGSYGASGLTPVVQRIAAQLPQGGLAPGSEANSLKSTDRFAAKLARLMARNPGRAPEQLARSISDGVRYAFVFDSAYYTEGTWLVHRKLKAHGFELEVRRNRWESPEYKGIWTRWRDPAHDICFEVQFHTPASWAVIQRTSEAHIRITAADTPAAERALLRARQVAAAAAAEAPPACAEIADFRQQPR